MEKDEIEEIEVTTMAHSGYRAYVPAQPRRLVKIVLPQIGPMCGHGTRVYDVEMEVEIERVYNVRINIPVDEIVTADVSMRDEKYSHISHVENMVVHSIEVANGEKR